MNKYWEDLWNNRNKTSLHCIEKECKTIDNTLKIKSKNSNSQIDLAEIARSRKLFKKVNHYILWKIQNEWNGDEQESN